MTLIHPIIQEIANNDRQHDPWGSGMMALGAVCDVLSVEGGHIPPEAGYRPAMGLGREALADTDEDSEFYYQRDLLAGMYPDEFPGYWVEGYEPNLTTEDLEYAAKVLHRYLALVKLAGRDY